MVALPMGSALTLHLADEAELPQPRVIDVYFEALQDSSLRINTGFPNIMTDTNNQGNYC